MTRLDPGPLDPARLGRGGGVRARLRSVGSSPLLVVGGTIGALLLLLPLLGILVAVLGEGRTDRGFVFFMAILIASGIWVLIDVLRKAEKGVGLEAFARANDLELTRSLAARHYAGSRFRSGDRIILHSLRTRTAPVLEIGDTWPTTRIRVRMSSTGAVTSASIPTAEAFLRVVLPGPDGATVDTASAPLPPELDAALGALLGAYTLEVDGREIVVMGTLPLEPDRPERARETFDVAAALARHAEARLTDLTRDPSTPSHDLPQWETRGGSRHPLAILGAVLAMFLAVPVGFAIVMSILDDLLPKGEGAARLVIGILITAATVVVWLVIRWATSRRGPTRGDQRRRR